MIKELISRNVFNHYKKIAKQVRITIYNYFIVVNINESFFNILVYLEIYWSCGIVVQPYDIIRPCVI